jgi:hypothetical protein
MLLDLFRHRRASTAAKNVVGAISPSVVPDGLPKTLLNLFAFTSLFDL